MTIGGEWKKLNKTTAMLYVEKTHFNYEQVMSLANVYKTIMRNSKTDKIDRQRFRDDLYKRFNMTDEFLLDRIFKVFDKDGDSYLSLEEWILGMSALVLGTQDELVELCYNVYNLTSDASFGRDEMFQLLRNSITRFNTDEDPDEGVRDLIELVLKKMDHDHDGRIGFEDFQKSVKSDQLYLEIFGNCLPAPELAEQFVEQQNMAFSD